MIIFSESQEEIRNLLQTALSEFRDTFLKDLEYFPQYVFAHVRSIFLISKNEVIFRPFRSSH